MDALNVIKIGGNVIDDEEALSAFLDAFSALPGPKVLVHGGGKLASAMGRSMGIEPRMVDGRRRTDAATLRIVTMTYAGWIGKNIAAGLCARGCPAVSICGADGGLMPATRRSPLPIDFGFVGDPDPATVRTDAIDALTAEGFTVVVAPITASAEGQLLNTNADTVAAALATALGKRRPTRLYLAFEKEGVLDAGGVVIPRIWPEYTDELVREGTVKDGMRPKLAAAALAAKEGVREVLIGSAEGIAGLSRGAVTATRVLAAAPENGAGTTAP
jgi:acetylglutamate kinase